jgi:apolipoprotein N-acyltransferase
MVQNSQEGKAGAMNRKVLLLSIASGVLLFLSFPKFDLSYLIWISLVPLLLALKGRTILEASLAGLITGLVYNIGIIYWVIFVVVNYGYLPVYAGVSVMLLLALYLGLYVSLFSAGVVFLRSRGIREVVSAPVLWTVLEYAKSYLLTGFPWENLAYSLHEHITFIQIADITGIYGIAFVIVVINCLVFDLLTTGVTRKQMLAELTAGCLLVLIVAGYGIYRTGALESYMKDIEPVKVSLIQGNIDQSIKWDPQFQEETLDIYKRLSLEASASDPYLIVWPETATPFFFQNTDDKHRDILQIAGQTGSYLLFGSPRYERRMGRNFLKNSAYVISPDSEITGRYDKIHLVPFGEYVPLRNLLFFIDKLVVGAGDFIPGSGLSPIMMGKEKAGVLICYEGIFPEISREYRRKGIDLLVNITNDAWYGKTSAPYQHLSMAAFRAVENRVYIVRAANTGISAIVDPTGKIVSKTGLFEQGILNETVKFIRLKTFYSMYGDLFVYICIVFMLAILTVSRSLHRRRSGR